jgi:ABC-type uncharacterized transport system permease subunit
MTKNMLLMAIVLLVVIGGWYWWSRPGGSLRFVGQNNFAEFTAQFDASVKNQRVLLLLSPT